MAVKSVKEFQHKEFEIWKYLRHYMKSDKDLPDFDKIVEIGFTCENCLKLPEPKLITVKCNECNDMHIESELVQCYNSNCTWQVLIGVMLCPLCSIISHKCHRCKTNMKKW